MQIWLQVNDAFSKTQRIRKFNLFVIKSVLESICKRFSKSAIRENPNLKYETQMKKKLMAKNDATIFTNTKKKKSSVSNFLLFCLNSGSKTQMHLKRFKFLLISARRNHFSKIIGVIKRASAVIGFFNIFQNTTIAVDDVENRKTCNIEIFGKRD